MAKQRGSNYRVFANVPAVRSWPAFRDRVYQSGNLDDAIQMADWFQVERIGGIGYPEGTTLTVVDASTGEMVHDATDTTAGITQAQSHQADVLGWIRKARERGWSAHDVEQQARQARANDVPGMAEIMAYAAQILAANERVNGVSDETVRYTCSHCGRSVTFIAQGNQAVGLLCNRCDTGTLENVEDASVAGGRTVEPTPEDIALVQRIINKGAAEMPAKAPAPTMTKAEAKKAIERELAGKKGSKTQAAEQAKDAVRAEAKSKLKVVESGGDESEPIQPPWSSVTAHEAKRVPPSRTPKAAEWFPARDEDTGKVNIVLRAKAMRTWNCKTCKQDIEAGSSFIGIAQTLRLGEGANAKEIKTGEHHIECFAKLYAASGSDPRQAPYQAKREPRAKPEKEDATESTVASSRRPKQPVEPVEDPENYVAGTNARKSDGDFKQGTPDWITTFRPRA